ncbi:hypothetical protein F511_13898 [Dorcoceras hygrometricum]|uniref:At2g29880-like C-terminal domain-containing protein n=1 Tax=Dorcoceras hygrometricum TaxID=472368 RepID=A0A2Z7DKP5_9LAMI|nr:hypothetical protein F511_13898 [Dorcoceras hygrometricum]
MRHNSGFGWDSNTKKFTAAEEVWEDYLKSHPKHEHYRSDTFEDYEDLRIVVGNGTATGKYSIGLGDDADARTYETEENREFASPLPSHDITSEIPPSTRKRDRTEFEAKSSAFKNTDQEVLHKFSHNLENITSKLESIRDGGATCWDAIKEVPNLDNRTRYKVLDLLTTRSLKMNFLKMTIEERSGWIDYKLNE